MTEKAEKAGRIEIITATNSGFCFGVRKAVDMLLGEIESGKTDSNRIYRIYLFGKIIHNNSFIRQVTETGVTIIGDDEIYSFDEDKFEENSTVVVRAHGIPKAVFEFLCDIQKRKNLKIADATCECVKRMHRIAEENTGEDTFTIILGDKNHPEIIALDSYVNGNRQIIQDFEGLTGLTNGFETFDLNEILKKNFKKLIILAQTTHNIKDYIKCADYIKERCVGIKTEAVFFDTICGATEKRQTEAELLSRESDVMIVVGDRSSSNTRKLYEICKRNCANSFIVETSEQLPFHIFINLFGGLKDSEKLKKDKGALKVTITAGASTPDGIIMEVKKIMTDIIDNSEHTENIKNAEIAESVETVESIDSIESIDSAENAENVESVKNIEEMAVDSGNGEADNNDGNKNKKGISEIIEVIEKEDHEKSFEELLNETFSTLNRGDRVKGTISYISDGEIHVDLGYKYTGVLAFDEVTDDSAVDLKEMFKVGDEIETQIIKTNDQEGIALLSKKRIDSTDNWDKITKFHEDGTVIEGKVVQVVNGGIIVLIDSIKVFVPASHADVSKDTDLQTLVGRNVKVKIIDINTIKRRAIASIRNASADERKAVEDKIWGEIELGRKYSGVVKSIANYGVFVDIGGIDGMVHITELSWSRIKHPSEVLQLGDKIEVYIKDFDTEKRRISLGYKNENENPWVKFTEETKVGDVVDAKILNTMPFGAFAEIVPGVDGLIHISQIANKKISKPSEILNIGDIVQVKITEINPEAKKISLSIRALLEPEQKLEPEPEFEAGDSMEETEMVEPVAPAEDAEVAQGEKDSTEDENNE